MTRPDEQAGTRDLQRAARAALASWTAPDPAAERLRHHALALLDEHPDATRRDRRPEHLTASALLVEPRHERTLLTLHPKVGRWLQLGGHCEADDSSLAAAARREAVEESGIDRVQIDPVPLTLDRHTVRCGAGDAIHLDVQFLALAPAAAHERCSGESLALAWFALDDLPDEVDLSVARLAELAHHRLLSRRSTSDQQAAPTP
ncbi:MAG: NUDIX domain-containing protein [Actinomycetes bacterium]